MHWPTWLYESLPWIYVLIGMLGLYFTNGSFIALVMAIILLGVAIKIKQLRQDYRFMVHAKQAAARERARMRSNGEDVPDENPEKRTIKRAR